MSASIKSYLDKVEQLKAAIQNADAILIGE